MSKKESNTASPDETELVKKPVVARSRVTFGRTIDNLVRQREIPIFESLNVARGSTFQA